MSMFRHRLVRAFVFSSIVIRVHRAVMHAWTLAPLLAAPLATGDDWYVDAAADCEAGQGTAEEPFCRIGDAVDAASSGDTIRIAPGTYDELVSLDKDLTLIGTDGREVTVVDGGRAGNVLTLQSGTNTEIVGLTITNGRTVNQFGGGVALLGPEPSSVVLRNSSISGNEANGGGFGVGGVVHNHANGSMSIYGSVLRDNYAAAKAVWGGTLSNVGTMRLVDCELVDNRCSGVYETGGTILNQGSLSIERCTIARNFTFYTGVAAIENLGGGLTIDGSILWGNGSIYPSAGRWSPIGGSATVTHSTVELGWPGEGNLALDPLFSNTVSGDYSLQSGSPCIDAGASEARPTGRDLTGAPRLLDGDLDARMRVDMGAREFGNLTLDVAGDATPGGTLTVTTGGRAGLFAWLGFGPPSDVLLLEPWGSVFFDLRGTSRVFPLGVNPTTQDYAVPVALAGLDLVTQAIGLASGGAPTAGNVSNPVNLMIE